MREVEPGKAFVLRDHARLIARKYVSAVLTVTVIVMLSTMMGFGEGFATNFIIGQCVGTCAFAFTFTALVCLRWKGPLAQMTGAALAMAAGACTGIILGAFFSGKDLFFYLPERSELIVQVVILTVMGGSLFRFILNSQEKIRQAGERIQREKIKRLTIEKKVVETNLRMLQAQIEPHFLFNTLSNILSLLDTDVDRGKVMISDLIAYLRISLCTSREEMATIGQEMEMIRAYLDIFKIRMGERLSYEIDVPDSLRCIPFPPMLIQPLVENAVRHGLEPRIEGGDIRVTASHRPGSLRIDVADSGLGFHEGSHWGVGLTNIKERLDTLYDGKASLRLGGNRPNGFLATIEVPHGTG
ncbi:sensor histidine kinase [Desulfoluna butyratoxydans]|uniref:Signal transduction histidine kinase internal region n=1 Tax=Desulfoluna butyratoxydans TaxID=231438 RepID=A0A4U8YUG5_9BACT|nr:histidine kinase [Desulfoluna butyratoxydans]VFQ44983.1 signal transduction histidine kinase internal region [Desulfoluna butyratoxydans]